ncbi:GW dipeptide domain-containing protein [Terribacillus saccharophilus]|uniref:GW dipeptide domain-containing protein n=1 Tax=Terribacillus saccharophilus TaxID=361277 RepID=UPI002DCEEDAC|nr:GW dipeptide domain-containing protein [Terribacillus saccharophilus]MEC0291204.1 GW dipeptide domain-containing protein [Terribacillus saccharophilus]
MKNFLIFIISVLIFSIVAPTSSSASTDTVTTIEDQDTTAKEESTEDSSSADEQISEQTSDQTSEQTSGSLDENAEADEQMSINAAEAESVQETGPSGKEEVPAEKAEQAEEKSSKLAASSVSIQEQTVDKFGHVKADAKIYQDIQKQNAYTVASKAGYTNAVYYIQKQASYAGAVYYHISTSLNANDKAIGWVKAADITTHDHGIVDNKTKTMYLNGKGSAYKKAWGGSKDLAISDLSGYKYQAIQVTQTDFVGNNTWYKATIGGNTIWIHSAYVTSSLPVETKAVQLIGHLKADVNIYPQLGSKDYKSANQGYTNQVYYISEQANFDGNTYYSIKLSENGDIIGWVKTGDMTVHDISDSVKTSKSLTLKGSGEAYTKPWGGSKDLAINLGDYAGSSFKVTATVKVGKNEWYQGTVDGKTVWIHNSYTSNYQANSIQRIGHVDAGKKVYRDLEQSSSTSSDSIADSVVDITKEANVNGTRYYLVSKDGKVIGWVKSSDVSSHPYTKGEAVSIKMYTNGSGSSYSKPWGGDDELVYKLSSYKNQLFKVDRIDRVGKNDWYHGTLNGKEMWIHSAYLKTELKITLSDESMIGHLDIDAKVYQDLRDSSNYKTADNAGLTNAVYYIKEKASIDGTVYYRIQTDESKDSSVVGYVAAKSMSTHTHEHQDDKARTLYIKGTGSAYTKPWGGSKDVVYGNLASYKNKRLTVDQADKIGKNTWYHGTLEGKSVWIHSSYVTSAEVKDTQRIGHLTANAVIYKDLDNLSNTIKAADGYTDAVYYIHSQATVDGTVYYHISTDQSVSKTIGWVKESAMSTHKISDTQKESKTLYIKGTGSAYSKPWGGSKDLVNVNLASSANAALAVSESVQVGSNTWYHGTVNGKSIWIHASYTNVAKESSTSLLGHLKADARIYADLGNQGSYQVADKANLTNAVYYIKKEAQYQGKTYYLISNEASSTKGVIGWVLSGDLNTHTHVGVDSKNKELYVKGTGSAYTKAWGGSKNLVYNLSDYTGEMFKVNKTEKVGNNVWYRGMLDGKEVFIHEDFVTTALAITIDEAVQIQLKAGAQIQDLNYNTYVSKEYGTYDSNTRTFTVTADLLNVRYGPSTSRAVVAQLTKGTKVYVISETDGWYRIQLSWINATASDIETYLDPTNFVNDDKYKFQFVDLSSSTGITAGELNAYLKGKGVLEGMGAAFITAGKNAGINEIYLVAHALLETGNGTSALAKGKTVNGKTYHNMYGVGAYDQCAETCGFNKAIAEDWDSVEAAIIGGAEFIGDGYINNGLNTLYKMRWNPNAMATTGTWGKQYATDIRWAYNQVSSMYNLYNSLGITNPNLLIPVYSK